MRNGQYVRRNRKKMKKPKKKAPKASVADLLQAASSAMESLDVERAYQAYKEASQQLQTDQIAVEKRQILIHVLEKMGECQVSVGDQDVAKGHFLQSLKLLEESSSEKNTNFYETHSSLCFYIGQLSLEKEALDAYRQGISSLEECIKRIEETDNSAMQDDTGDTSMDDDSNNNLLVSLRQKLSGAYCNIAELYLTDLCEEETAETDCETYLEKALQLKDADGEPLVDALQTMASLRLSQKERQLEAVPFILRAYEKQRVGSEALAALVGLNQKSEGETDKAQELLEVDAANNLPEFEFRCQTAKLLLECAGLLSESNVDGKKEDECVTAAISVLGSLLAQNDEVIEIWYLTGCAFCAKKPPLTDTARFYLERAKEMLTDIRKAMKDQEQWVDDSEKQELLEQLEMNEVQRKDVQTKLDELPASDNMMEDD